MKSIKRKIQKRLIQTNIHQKPVIILKNLPENKHLTARLCKGSIVETWLSKKTYKYPLYLQVDHVESSVGARQERFCLNDGKSILLKTQSFVLTDTEAANLLKLSHETIVQTINKSIKLLTLAIMRQFVATALVDKTTKYPMNFS